MYCYPHPLEGQFTWSLLQEQVSPLKVLKLTPVPLVGYVPYYLVNYSELMYFRKHVALSIFRI